MSYFYDKNMNVIELPDGVTPLEIYVSSMEKNRVTSTIEGRHGKIDYGYTFVEREASIRILLKGRDRADYQLLYDEVYALFHLNDHIYLIEPLKKGKRFLVSIDNTYAPSKLNPYTAIVEIECTTVELPFAESIGTTQDIQRDGINSDKELWGFGMGLIADDESLIYTHTGTSFRIFNAGNVPVHPFEQDLKITISNVQGSTSFLELRNLTTGSIFRVNEAVTSDKKIILDGPNLTINSLQALRKTNRKFIELAPGWNNFAITGATSAKVEFDFHFYYL